MAGAELGLVTNAASTLPIERSRVRAAYALEGAVALRSPGIRWIRSHGFPEGCRNSACEAVAIAYRYDGVHIDNALRELVSWGRDHLPGYPEREIIAVIQSNYRRERPHGLSSCRLLDLVDCVGNRMPSLAAALSCEATGGPGPKRRKRLADRKARPLVEELTWAIASIADGRLRGVATDAQAAATCAIPPAQYARRVKPILRDLGLASASSKGTHYRIPPDTYRRLSRPNLMRLIARDAKVPAHRVLSRMRTLYRHLLAALFSLCDRLRSLLRPIVFAIAGPSRLAGDVVHAAGCAIESRSPPWSERQ